MNQTKRILSTYTADVSGVCSALYELSGMVVMHDPSGCNSTYNTHDEPRWYDFDSQIFISGLTEIDAIMGNDQKLIDDITDTAKELHPAFIAIAGTPIPMITGCDIPAIARQLENELDIPCFGFTTNGMNSYISGASAALAEYVKRMTVPAIDKAEKTVNILGVTPLDFSVNGSDKSMAKLLESSGYTVNSVIAMGSTPDSIKNAGKAGINLVVSSTGLEAARILKEKFKTPYIIGTPYGNKFSQMLINNLAADDNKNSFAEYAPPENTKNYIIGESVTSRSLAYALYLETEKHFKVICPLEAEQGILSQNDLPLSEETDIEKCLENAKTVIADPMYRPVVPEKAKFISLPHEAYSGRIYRNQIPDLTGNIDKFSEELK